ncbi:MAG TPA: hypothetical protein VFM18_07285, partial [Methanosarcina sp.]|nr:hypothetical protein [Methanosarcina sp.]
FKEDGRQNRQMCIESFCTSKESKNMAYTSSIGQSRQREYVGQVNQKTYCDWEADRPINSGQGNKGWWESEPNVGRVANGVADRMGKLKALGNGQVPLQAAVSYSILKELFNK